MPQLWLLSLGVCLYSACLSVGSTGATWTMTAASILHWLAKIAHICTVKTHRIFFTTCGTMCHFLETARLLRALSMERLSTLTPMGWQILLCLLMARHPCSMHNLVFCDSPLLTRLHISRGESHLSYTMVPLSFLI